MKVLVCGGRDFYDREKIFKALDALQESRVKITELCHGGAKGADSIAGEYAQEKNIPCKVFPAQWKMYGNSAGSVRNVQMLNIFNPDLVISFQGGKGTAHMVKISRAKLCEVLEIL
jgi:hypothetical protein